MILKFCSIVIDTMDVVIEKSDSRDLLGAWKVKEKCRKEKNMLRQDFLTFSADFTSNNSYVAKKKKKIVGFIIFRDTGYISIFGVHPNYTREGIGTKLINIPKREHERLWCHVRETNREAIEFYKSRGFKIKKTVNSYYLSGDDAKLMIYGNY